jgi:antitoxin ParD1/3/4
MSTMNISLPEAMKEFVDEQVAQRGFGTSSEYLRDLIRKEQDREKLRQLILDGVASGRGAVADAAYFSSLRARVGQRAAAGAAKSKLPRARAR